MSQQFGGGNDFVDENGQAHMQQRQDGDGNQERFENEFEGYDQANLEMFQQQDQPFYPDDLRQ